MIFGVRNTDQFEFKLRDTVLSICDEFKYLGVIFSKNRSFYKAIRHNVEHAKKALHLLHKKIRNLNLPLDLQLYLFDHTILPILLYGCEIWGFQNTQVIENVYNQFLRSITGLRKSTPIYMLHAEMGRHPIDILIKSRTIGFWISLINSNDGKISKTLYNILFNEAERGHNCKWITYIKDILISVGRLHLFNQPYINNPIATKQKIVQTLKDINTQAWNANLLESNKGRNYSIFKQEINFEHYIKTLSRTMYLPLLRFRSSNHRLPVETGRWINTPYEERKCQLCDNNDIGDEFHYLLLCPFFANERISLIKPYYYNRPNILKYMQLLQSKNKRLLSSLSKFVSCIISSFQ